MLSLSVVLMLGLYSIFGTSFSALVRMDIGYGAVFGKNLSLKEPYDLSTDVSEC